MKKMTALLAAIILLVTMTAAVHAETTDLFAQLKGQVFMFSSGVGAWYTELIVGEDGSFTGDYHDSEMGDTGEGYPDGTVYGCSFHGQFTDPAAVDEYTWTAGVTVSLDAGQALQTIEDDIRYVLSPPYGLEKAKTVTFFLPGTPVDRLPEGFMFWSHLQETDPGAQTLPFYAIWSETDEAGFVAESVTGGPEAGAPMLGGWTPAADPAVTDEVKALVGKALDGLVGVNYVPVAYLGSQLVAGTNHAILCQAAAVYPDAQTYFVILYLYEDLQGNVTVLNIADFDIGSLCTYGAPDA